MWFEFGSWFKVGVWGYRVRSRWVVGLVSLDFFFNKSFKGIDWCVGLWVRDISCGFLCLGVWEVCGFIGWLDFELGFDLVFIKNINC